MLVTKQNKTKTIFFTLAAFLWAGIFQVSVAQAASTGYFPYRLLEGIPGFFNRGDVIPNLETLISSIYKFGIWTVGISAMFMIIIGGFMYVTSAGNKSTAGSAKGIINDALLGLAVALTAYLFLYVINPDLIKLNLDSIISVKIVEVKEAEEAEVRGDSVSQKLVTRNGYQIDESIAKSLDIISGRGINTVVTSGFRSVEQQKQIIIDKCGGYPPVKACSVPVCLLKNGPTSCPHTTGRAVDVWALAPDGKQAISQDQCKADINACFNNPAQKALIAAMREQSFCVLTSEPWHFERPHMSKACI